MSVRVALFERFAALGRAPTHAELAEAAGIEVGDVPAALHELAEQRMIVLEPGSDEISMANPFSAVPTAYMSVVDGRRYFANCIWDAFGVIAMLGGEGAVETGEMRVDVADGRAVAPPGALVHFAVPAAHWWDDIGFT